MFQALLASTSLSWSFCHSQHCVNSQTVEYGQVFEHQDTVIK